MLPQTHRKYHSRLDLRLLDTIQLRPQILCLVQCFFFVFFHVSAVQGSAPRSQGVASDVQRNCSMLSVSVQSVSKKPPALAPRKRVLTLGRQIHVDIEAIFEKHGVGSPRLV